MKHSHLNSKVHEEWFVNFVGACSVLFVILLLVGCGGSSDSATIADSSNNPPVVTPPQPEPEPENPPKAISQGIFHSAGFIRSNNESDTIVQPNIEGQDYISGTLIRVAWKVVNPSEGIFDFSAIERELAQAAIYDSNIHLAILDSNEIPQYVLDQCETFNFVFRDQETHQTCLPWDQQYQGFKQALLAKLGAQFDDHPNLSAIYFSYAAMTNGIEMHWRVDEAEYTAAGYTPERLSTAYNDVMDMYNQAFPTTSVIMEIHEVFNSSELADNAFEHCYEQLGSRCGVAIWWCASRMATDPNELEYKVYHIAQQATVLSFALCQTIGSFTTSPERFDQGQGWTSEQTFRFEMDFFINQGFQVFELWSNDVQNPSLVSIIQDEIAPRL